MLNSPGSGGRITPMNVQEELLRTVVDPALTDEALGEFTRKALKEGDKRPRIAGYRVLTGGCWNRVIAVDAGGYELVLKISPHSADEKIIREYAVLRTFAEMTELPVPEPLYLDAGGDLLPGTTLAMTRVPGAVMHECFGYLDDQSRARISSEIAVHLATLHAIRGRGFGGVELPEEERANRWADFWLPRFDSVIADAAASGVVSEILVDGAKEIRPHLHSLLDIGPESTFTHYDIWSGNVMIDTESDPPRVSGYIDIPGFYADYARELSFAMLFGVADRSFFETYLGRREIDQHFASRASLYNLKMNIRHIMMYPGQTVYQRGARECLDLLKAVLGTDSR
jgi:fructosamine-3-kinase